ncbi:MAG TPA: lipid-binding SYLF domain-containing protein [Terriglobales bacterium]|nr:lipid-binding SYLF domain-containing protein [Terriglobales bacterium]
MKKLMVLLLVFGICGLARAADDKAGVEKRLDNAATVLQQITSAPDKGIPQEVLNGAKCVAVVPHMLKAGFGIGGQHGKGVATCNVNGTWSAPAFFSLSGGSFGFQIGAEGVDLVILAMNEQGMQALLKDKFQVGGEASAAAGPVGREASAQTDWKAHPLLTYSRTKGAFAGVSLNGAVMSQDKEATDAFYGQPMASAQLLSGAVPAPPDAKMFLNAVQQAETTARAR